MTTENVAEQVADDTTDNTAVENETVEATLTQADVDRIVKDRLAREKAKYADYDDLKAAAAKWAEVEESQKTEVEKANEAAAAATARADALQQRIRTQAVVTAAVQGGAVNPEQVAALIDISDIEDEDLSVIGERVSAFLNENPHFVRATGAPVPVVKGNEVTGDKKALSLDDIAAMDPREVAKNPDLMAALIQARNNV